MEVAIEIVVVPEGFGEELFVLGRVFFFHPEFEVVFVGEVFVGHVAWVAAVGNFADSIDTVERDAGAVGFAAKLIVGDQPFTSDDEFLRSPGDIEIRNGGSTDAGVAEASAS